MERSIKIGVFRPVSLFISKTIGLQDATIVVARELNSMFCSALYSRLVFHSLYVKIICLNIVVAKGWAGQMLQRLKKPLEICWCGSLHGSVLLPLRYPTKWRCREAVLRFRETWAASAFLTANWCNNGLQQKLLVSRFTSVIVTKSFVWFSGNTLVSVNVVTLRRARLVPGWVTPRSTQPEPSLRG